jgi:protein-S-isoprenylcysteine O-methyltransferase Ste14
MSFRSKRLNPRVLSVYALGLGILWFSRPSPATIALGLLPIALGEGLRLWATGFLHKNDALTVAGPYAYLRHPLYLGSFLIGLGFAVMAGHAAAWVVFAGITIGFVVYYLPYKDRIEGARLEAAYGDAFRRYQAAVPRVLPRLVPYRPLPADTGGVTEWQTVRFADNNERGLAYAVSLGVLAMAVRWALL